MLGPGSKNRSFGPDEIILQKLRCKKLQSTSMNEKKKSYSTKKALLEALHEESTALTSFLKRYSTCLKRKK